MGDLNEQQMQMAMGYFGGPQGFQQCVNSANADLQQMGLTPEQYIQQGLQSGKISQQSLQEAMARANQIFGRR